MIKYSHLNKKNKNKKNSNHKYLCYTNLLLIVSLFYFLFNIQETKNKPYVEYILASFLILTIIFSQLFWNNPIRIFFA